MIDRLIDTFLITSVHFLTIVSFANLVIIPFYTILDTSASLVLITDGFLVGLCAIVKTIQYVNNKFSKF